MSDYERAANVIRAIYQQPSPAILPDCQMSQEYLLQQSGALWCSRQVQYSAHLLLYSRQGFLCSWVLTFQFLGIFLDAANTIIGIVTSNNGKYTQHLYLCKSLLLLHLVMISYRCSCQVEIILAFTSRHYVEQAFSSLRLALPA